MNKLQFHVLYCSTTHNFSHKYVPIVRLHCIVRIDRVQSAKTGYPETLCRTESRSASVGCLPYKNNIVDEHHTAQVAALVVPYAFPLIITILGEHVLCYPRITYYPFQTHTVQP